MAEIDLDYIRDSSIIRDDRTSDVDTNNKSILVKHLNDVDEKIALHNSLDVIAPNKDFTGDEQIIAHKLFVQFLREFREELVDKIEELNDGR